MWCSVCILYLTFIAFSAYRATGSFKERGARNALMLLSDEQKKRGVIAASAGNHALVSQQANSHVM